MEWLWWIPFIYSCQLHRKGYILTPWALRHVRRQPLGHLVEASSIPAPSHPTPTRVPACTSLFALFQNCLLLNFCIYLTVSDARFGRWLRAQDPCFGGVYSLLGRSNFLAFSYFLSAYHSQAFTLSSGSHLSLLLGTCLDYINLKKILLCILVPRTYQLFNKN